MQQQIQDRERVKELIQSILPNFKRKIDSELERKNKVLTDNPRLLQLYKDLVISKVLTSEEFWVIHDKELQALKDSSSKQDAGVSGNFLSEIKPVTDGCNGFKYNLTGEIIDSVFKAYPGVKKKYTDCVPAKLSESEFWTKFFQSHYFHRDRVATGIKDIFSDSGKIDDSILKKDVRKNMNDPFLNIARFGDNTIEEGFCSSSTHDQKESGDPNNGNIVHQSIIKRFNQHSVLVLKTCKEPQQTQQPVAAAANGSENKEESSKRKSDTALPEVVAEEDPASMQMAKKQKIAEKIQYDDLGDAESCEKQNVVTNELNLEKLEKHLFGTDQIKMPQKNSKGYSLDMVDQTVRRLANEWNQRTTHKQLIHPAMAVQALGELSPGGALMSGYHDHNLSNFVSTDVEKEVSNLYLSAGELLREFWSAFPPITPEKEQKAIKMHETLQRFYSSKVKTFEDRISRDLSPLSAQIIQHLNLLMDTAFKKFQRRVKTKDGKY
jgi:transcription initiation factor TFIIH subunit 1